MNVLTFWSRHRLLGAAVVFSLFLAACGPAPLGIDWAAITTVGEEQNILVANGSHLVMVSPVDGQPIRLRNADGEPLLDDEGNPRIWEVKSSDAENAQFYSAPVAVNDSTLLVAAYNNRIYQVNIPRARVENPSGDPVRNNGNTHIVADPLLSNDLLYVGLAAHDMVALNREDLSERWSVNTGHGVWSKPRLVDGALYFTSLDHFLYAVDAETGDELWRLDLQGTATDAPVYLPAAEDGGVGHLFIGSFARKIYDISTDGEILNEYTTHGWVWNSPTLMDGILYAADLEGWVYALDAQDGLSEVWTPHQLAPSAIRPSPVVFGDTVVVATRDGHLHWLNRDNGAYLTDTADDGSFVNRVRALKGQVFSDVLLIESSDAVALDSPIVVVSTMAPEEILVAFNANTGERLWSYPQQ